MKIVLFSIMAFLLIAFSCVNDGIDGVKIDFYLSEKRVSKDMSLVVMKFTAHENVKFIFDWKALSNFCPVNEDSALLKKLNDRDFLIKNLKRSQVVIENDLSEFALYSLAKTADVGVTHPVELINCFSDWSELVDLRSSQSETLKSDPVSTFSLTISKSEKKRRFHYYFISTETQRAQGYHSMVITSNWF